MPTTATRKGQVTIPKPIRDALGLHPGMSVEFSVNQQGEVVLNRVDPEPQAADRFEAARGKAGRQAVTAKKTQWLR